ncbi:MAG: HAD family hydrolase [Pseudomonadota bacterium]
MTALPLIRLFDTDLVIFDCDGVLVDSEPLSNAVMAEHITRLGWPMDGTAAMARFKGRTMAQVHAAVEAHLGRTLDPVWRDGFHRDQEARMRLELRAVPGVAALIGRVHAAGLASCVASQGRHEKMAVSLGATGLLETFRGRIFSAVDVARPKPFPDLFLHAAARMGASPGRCIVIEDSPTGLEAARAAGMRVIGYDPDGTLAREASRDDGAAFVRAMEKIGVG